MQKPTTPEIIINWGNQSPENEKEWKAWVADMIRYVIHNTDEIDNIARDIFDEVHHVGYTEGYDSCECEGEGL